MNFVQFKNIYNECLNEVWKFFTKEMQDNIARHCYNWLSGKFNFYNYLLRSSIRFFNCYSTFINSGNIKNESISILDIGGFWGVFALTMKKLGYNIQITEKLGYYNHAFDRLFSFMQDSGIEIIDIDLVQSQDIIGYFSHITCMALIEHLPHSPAILMKNIYSNLQPHGKLYLEAPNIAYWPNRINLLRGTSPLPHIENIYKSTPPYIGHFHEYTTKELVWLVQNSGLLLKSKYYLNYSIPPKFRFGWHCLRNLPAYLFDNCKELLIVIAEKA